MTIVLFCKDFNIGNVLRKLPSESLTIVVNLFLMTILSDGIMINEIIMLILEIRFNQLNLIPKAAILPIYHHARFSNQRMIVADFALFSEAIGVVFKQAQTAKIFRPSNHFLGSIVATPISVAVNEPLADGLSPIENRVIYEGVLQNHGKVVEIRYLGNVVFETK